MGRRNDAVPAAVYERSLALRVCAPEDENYVLATLGERAHDGIREDLPALVLVASGAMRGYGESGVQEQHALVGPLQQVRHVSKLLRDVEERRRRLDVRRDIKRQSLGLPGLVIGVLSENDDLDLVERGAVEGVEYLAGRRIDYAVSVGVLHKCDEIGEVWFFKLRRKYALPRFFDFNFHRPNKLKKPAYAPSAQRELLRSKSR